MDRKSHQLAANAEGRIQPWSKNPRYWQYKGEPVLLLGGSKDDDLFQIPDLEEHLDLIASVGGNYIRNTMSERQDMGFEIFAYKQLEDGKYDLTQWNPRYWQRFSQLLELAEQRNVIIQIEVWDRFDYSCESWLASPYNPANNINYTAENSGLAHQYPEHPAKDLQPFFHTIPGMEEYDPSYDVVRAYQHRFVSKILSYSFNYGNVLYCMSNETTTSPKWGQYWIKFIEDKASEAGVSVCATDMFDRTWNAKQCQEFQEALSNPDIYKFLDISQVNAHKFGLGQDHWDQLSWIFKQLESHQVRPVNHTKIYGGEVEASWVPGSPADGIERFWRNVLAGSAAVRFHRPIGGNGLNSMAQATIQAMRKVESVVRLWDVTSHMELLDDRGENQAYLAADPGRCYILYFTDGGDVKLDLREHTGDFNLRWVNIATGEWGSKCSIRSGGWANIAAPDKGGWAAAIVAQ